MGKKKKKGNQSGLSSQEREIAATLQITGTPEAIHNRIQTYKERHRNLVSVLGMEAGPCQQPANTDAAKALLKRTIGSGMQEYVDFAKILLEGYWMHNRRTYKITEEAVALLNNDDFWLIQSELPFSACLRTACENPLVLDLSEIGGDKALCSWLSIRPDEYRKKIAGNEEAYSNIVVLRYGDQIRGTYDCHPLCSIKKFMEDAKKEFLSDKSRYDVILIYKALIYIGYLKHLHESDGQYIIKGQLPAHYIVNPIPMSNDDPIPGSTPEWANAGMRLLFGYLSREKMLKDFSDYFATKAPDYLSEIPDGPLEQLVKSELSCKLAAQWEQDRIIYQYDDDTGTALLQKYGEGLARPHFLDGLVEYFPSQTIAVSCGNKSTCLVSECKVVGHEDPEIIVVDVSCPEPFCLVVGKEAVKERLDAFKFADVLRIRETLCAIKHILTVFKNKSEQKLAKDPEPRKPRTTTGKLVEAQLNKKMPTSISGCEIPLSMFELTPRAVKKVTDEAMVHRYGWKMTPHTRRRHPHRYWVGKGENRHLEVRWLDEMKINGNREKEGRTPVVTHTIR